MNELENLCVFPPPIILLLLLFVLAATWVLNYFTWMVCLNEILYCVCVDSIRCRWVVNYAYKSPSLECIWFLCIQSKSLKKNIFFYPQGVCKSFFLFFFFTAQTKQILKTRITICMHIFFSFPQDEGNIIKRKKNIFWYR